MVEDIEELRPELEGCMFGDGEVLEHIDVNILMGWSHKIIPVFVSECVLCRSRESRVVKPLLLS